MPEVKWKMIFSVKIPGEKMFFRNRWYLRASSLLAYNTKITNFMPTIKLVFPVKWQSPQSRGSECHCQYEVFRFPRENKKKTLLPWYLKRKDCGAKR